MRGEDFREDCGSEEGKCLVSLSCQTATGATFHAAQLSSCLQWGAPGGHGESVGVPQNLAFKSCCSGCPGGLPGTPSVWIMAAPLATQGRWGGRCRGLLTFSSVFFLLLLKGGPFTSTWKTESVLGMCQAKQKHMVWIYSPKIEQEKGGKESSLL